MYSVCEELCQTSASSARILFDKGKRHWYVMGAINGSIELATQESANMGQRSVGFVTTVKYKDNYLLFGILIILYHWRYVC